MHTPLYLPHTIPTPLYTYPILYMPQHYITQHTYSSPQNELLAALEDHMDSTRRNCPRLYFVSDACLTRLLVASSKPRVVEPYIRNCFRGCEAFTFDLPNRGSAASGRRGGAGEKGSPDEILIGNADGSFDFSLYG